MELTPTRASFAPNEPVTIELTAAPAGVLRVVSLTQTVANVTVEPGAALASLGELPHGGYGVEFVDATGTVLASTAVDVLSSPFERPRYGFVARMDADADTNGVARFARRMHLNLTQFYDWGFRHSELMPPTRTFFDPLGLPRDLDAIDGLARALSEVGSAPLGYSAVYAIGHDEIEDWRDAMLVRSDGEPYRLGENFLVLLDPAHPRWLEHYVAQLARALQGTELTGFHLDQYGWPKFALRGDGERVDLAASFRTLIDAVGDRIPAAQFIFNNVNDFGTMQTAGATQHASYIEVWSPHETLGDLGLLATRTRALRPEHPPILSAYLSCYTSEPSERADSAAQLVMATAFSHGATHLLLGEGGAALVDPYYPTNHELPQASIDMFVAWYDFLVRWGDVLLGPDVSDVTEFMTCGINGDVIIEGPEAVDFSTKAEPGRVWTRVTRTDRGMLVHLIDLRAQNEVAWDAGKTPAEPLAGLSLRLSPVAGVPEVSWASPGAEHGMSRRLEGEPASESVATDSLSAGQTYVRYALPEFTTWGFAFIPVDQYL